MVSPFQYHTGPIKSLQGYLYTDSHRRFNTTLVQLKDDAD